MAAPPAFAVGALAPLAKTLPREEYMRLVMTAFQDAKRKKEEEIDAASRKKTRPEIASRVAVAGGGEYTEELRAMLYTFGANRDADGAVLLRLEELARAYLTQLCAQLTTEIKVAEGSQRRGTPRGLSPASKRTSPKGPKRKAVTPKKGKKSEGCSAEEEIASGAQEGADGEIIVKSETEPTTTPMDAGLKNDGQLPSATPTTPAVKQRVLKLEHVASVLGEAADVQRLADVVIALRSRRHEKTRASLDNEAEADGDLFPRAMLEAAAGAVGEGRSSGNVLSEPFWQLHGVTARASSTARLQRLQRRDELTKALPASDYLQWSECAKLSFTKPKRRKKFLAWSGLDGARAPFVANKELVDVLGQLAYEHVERLVTAAVAHKTPTTPFPLLIVADLPDVTTPSRIETVQK